MPWSNGTVTVAILFFVNLINYMDRFTIAGILTKVQDYYSLSNSQGGLLQTCFVISYMLTAPVFGYLGDRYSRKYIMAGGVLFWSCTTHIGSIIPKEDTFAFYLSRALVGIGEASYSTIAPTLIADLFVNEMRTRMLSVFFFAIPVGSGLGYVVGSHVAEAFGNWRWALRVTPPLGMLSVVLIMFLLEEPVRGQSEGSSECQASIERDLKGDLMHLARNRSYIWSTIGFTCVCFAIGGLSWWAPKYMVLAAKYGKHEIKDQTSDLIFGAITAVAGILGVVLGSVGAQIYRKYNARADPLLCSFGVFLSIPFTFLGLAIAKSSMPLSWVSIFIAIVALCINWTLTSDILLYVITPSRRSFAQSIQILFSHLLGDAFSPYFVGMVSMQESKCVHLTLLSM